MVDDKDENKKIKNEREGIGITRSCEVNIHFAL